MKRFKLTTGIIFILVVLQSAWCKDYKLFYLGGQSNMDGYGYVDQLPPELNSPVKGVMIFHGNSAPDGVPADGRGLWSTLRPGHGVGCKSDGTQYTYSNRFGVELTFARRLKELYPDSNIAIIKYSRGGTSIDISSARQFGCWDPDFTGGTGPGKGINQYDHFLAAVRNALSVKDIDSDGTEDTLTPACIVWMQGESDACTSEQVAIDYQQNLKRLMDLIRAAFRVDDLPVVIGRISDAKTAGPDKDQKQWPYGDTLRVSQKNFVDKDPCAALVTSTDSYGYSDPWHYDSPGYIDLGKQFADAYAKIRQNAN